AEVLSVASSGAPGCVRRAERVPCPSTTRSATTAPHGGGEDRCARAGALELSEPEVRRRGVRARRPAAEAVQAEPDPVDAAAGDANAHAERRCALLRGRAGRRAVRADQGREHAARSDRGLLAGPTGGGPGPAAWDGPP